jgi:biopolymer transport protein ExbD
MYDFSMRNRFTSALAAAAIIFFGILLQHEVGSAYAQSRPNPEGFPVISITRTGALYLNEMPVNINILVDELRRNSPAASEVYIKVDKNAVWELVVPVLAALNAAKPAIEVKFALPQVRFALPQIPK